MKRSFVTVLSSIIILSLLTAVLLSSCSLFGTKEENDKNSLEQENNITELPNDDKIQEDDSENTNLQDNSENAEESDNVNTENGEDGEDISNAEDGEPEQGKETVEQIIEKIGGQVIGEVTDNDSLVLKLVNAIVNSDMQAVNDIMVTNLSYFEIDYSAYFANTVFDGYEIFQISLPQEQTNQVIYPQGYDTYLVNFKVQSTDCPGFYPGNNYRLLLASKEYGIDSFYDTDLFFKFKEYENTGETVQNFINCMYRGLYFADGYTPASDIDFTDYLHNFMHYFYSLYNEDVYSLGWLNEYFSARVNGFKPLSVAQLVNNPKTYYFLDEGIDVSALDNEDDVPIYACTLGHGGIINITSFEDAEYSKNDVTVSFTIYGDWLRLIPAVSTEFCFDISDEEIPTLMSVFTEKITDYAPLVYSV